MGESKQACERAKRQKGVRERREIRGKKATEQVDERRFREGREEEAKQAALT